MIRTAKEMRAAAREALSGKWSGAAVVTLVYGAAYGLIPGFLDACSGLDTYGGLGTLVQVLLLPLAWGFSVLFLDNVRSGNAYKVEQLSEGFKDYTRVLGTMLLAGIYTCLWTLLLIVPGIVKSYSYAMTPYVLRDNPELKFNGAIERSMKMMDGHKFDLFYLHLTFIGWYLLCMLTFCIGFLWLIPYVQSATAHFYEEVKAEYEEKEEATENPRFYTT